MKLKDALFLNLGFIVIVLLVSCQFNTETTPTKILEQTQVETSSEVVPVITPSTTSVMKTIAPFSTLTTPTSTIIISNPKPLQTLSPTETGTPTPWPTLLPDEAAKRVVTLLDANQNSDCLLPCWWGATPGQTQWQDIEPFLKSFALVTKSPKGATVKIPLPEPIAVPNFDYYISYGLDESGIIRQIAVKSMNIRGYDPKTMLSLYGIPDEVWLKTFSEILPGGVLPFQLIIIYQEQGISFHYHIDASRSGEFVTACFEPGVVETERPDIFPTRTSDSFVGTWTIQNN